MSDPTPNPTASTPPSGWRSWALQYVHIAALWACIGGGVGFDLGWRLHDATPGPNPAPAPPNPGPTPPKPDPQPPWLPPGPPPMPKPDPNPLGRIQPQPAWEWREIPGFEAPTMGYGRMVDGEFLVKEWRRK